MLRLIPFLIAATVALFLLADAAVAEPPASPVKSSVTPCIEDESCWRWSTMGNLQRGVVVKRAARAVGRPHPNSRPLHRVVSACEFAYLSHEGLLNYRRTPRLRGDEFARRHGCDYRFYA